MSTSTRILRGGATRAILYREDTGDVLDVPARFIMARNASGILDVQRERVAMGSGSRREKSRTRELPMLVSEMGHIEAMQAWIADRAQVRGIVLGNRRGAHRIWDEPTTLELDESDAPFSQIAGYTARFYSAAYHASVALSDDLLATSAFTDDDEDGLADAYSLWESDEDVADVAFDGSERLSQSLEVDAEASAAIFVTRSLPIKDTPLKVRALVEIEDAATSSGEVRLVMQALSYAERNADWDDTTPLAETFDAVEGSGSRWLDLSLPAGTFAVRIGIEVTAEDEAEGDPESITFGRFRLFTREVTEVPVIGSAFDFSTWFLLLL